MLEKKERQIVLDCLYQEIYESEMRKSGLTARSAMIAKIDAELKYQKMSTRQRVGIYYNFICKKITEYIREDMQKSNTMYWVNGDPEKRNMRIDEYARYAYTRMPVNQKVAICNKLGYKYISN